MKLKSFVFVLVLSAFYCHSECKGGRGGSFGRGGGFGRSSSSGSSKTSSSGGWFSSSKPSSNSRPSTSGASNTNSNSKPIGWNVPGHSSPAGPPPAYPGLANRPVSNGNNPPAYSPSFNNPPAYSPSYNRPNTYNTYSSNQGSFGSANQNPYAYGSQFGRSGLGGNTYISNNYYGNSRSSGGSGFLTSALFYGAGMHHGYMWGSNSYRRKSWDEDEDRRWRATTKAPYFENKVPGSESYLPAAAVVGAAAAFGLVSLLPLNVPENKPLMYCNSTDIAQTQIRLDGNIYSCLNQTIAISCPRSLENSTIIDECLTLNKTMECDLKESKESFFCTNATLVSRVSVVCNSTSLMNGVNINETTTILNCYEGILSEKIASFIPTTTTEAPVTTTTEKELSLNARVHIFFMKLIGKGDVVEKVLATTTTTTPEPTEDFRLLLKENETSWVPEALTISPEPITSSEEPASLINNLHKDILDTIVEEDHDHELRVSSKTAENSE